MHAVEYVAIKPRAGLVLNHPKVASKQCARRDSIAIFQGYERTVYQGAKPDAVTGPAASPASA